jgi:hypothetical protein
MEDFVMASLQQVRSGGPVRISLPARVAYNKDALKKTIVSVVENLGCPRCFSGHDCQFSLERNLIVDPDGKVSGSGESHIPSLAVNPDPVPWKVVVGFQGTVAFNIDQVLKAVDNVIAGLAEINAARTAGPTTEFVPGIEFCNTCHSGRDVTYVNEVILIGVDQNQQTQHYGGALST